LSDILPTGKNQLPCARYSARFGQELTEREREVISHVLLGISNAQIADALFIHHKTVKFHLSRIYKKLGVKNRGQLILKECGR